MVFHKICEEMHKKLEHLSLFLGVVHGKDVSSGQRDLEICFIIWQSHLMREFSCTTRGSAVSQSDEEERKWGTQ